MGCDSKEQVLKAYTFRTITTFKRKSGMSKLLSINFLMGLSASKRFDFINFHVETDPAISN